MMRHIGGPLALTIALLCMMADVSAEGKQQCTAADMNPQQQVLLQHKKAADMGKATVLEDEDEDGPKKKKGGSGGFEFAKAGDLDCADEVVLRTLFAESFEVPLLSECL